MKRPRLLILGNVVANVVARAVDALPRAGSLHPETIEFHPGGCACNTAIGLARLGVETRLVACLGSDPFGKAMLDRFDEQGIDTRHCAMLQGEATGVAIVLVDSAGERRFISTRGANDRLSAARVPDEALEGAFALHVGGFFGAAGLEDGTLRPLLERARERGAITSLDPVGGSARERRAALFPLLPHLDILMLNEDEGEKVTGEREPDAVTGFLMARGARLVVLKRGAAGCMARGDDIMLDLPAFPATALDSTGAGDAFAAGLLASLSRGDSLRESLLWASAAGAATVEAMGAPGLWQGWSDLRAVRDRLPDLS